MEYPYEKRNYKTWTWEFTQTHLIHRYEYGCMFSSLFSGPKVSAAFIKEQSLLALYLRLGTTKSTPILALILILKTIHELLFSLLKNI